MALQVANLVVRYGRRLAVDDISFSLAAGEFALLLGPNGAGKSTTLAAVSGALAPTSGEIRVTGDGIEEAGATAASAVAGSRAAAQWIGFADQPPGLYDYFTVTEHVAFVAEARGASPAVAAAQTAATLATLGLTAIAPRPCRELSYGMRQRVGLAAALVGNTRVVLLDETLNGLDPHATRHAYTALSAYTASGGAVLLSTHLLGGLPPRCDRVMLMYGGKITQNLAGAELATLLARGPDALNDLYLAHIPDTGPT